MTLVHATLSPGARLTLPWRPDYNALVYAMAGQGSVGSEGRPIGMGQLAVLGPGDALTVAAASHQESRSPNLDVLVLGGRPIREPVAWMGPFVMNTREEVMQAVADYQAGRLGSIPAVHNTPTTLIQTDRPTRKRARLSPLEPPSVCDTADRDATPPESSAAHHGRRRARPGRDRLRVRLAGRGLVPLLDPVRDVLGMVGLTLDRELAYLMLFACPTLLVVGSLLPGI